MNVEMKWFDERIAIVETFAAGKIDGEFQTLNDTPFSRENGGRLWCW